MTKGILYHKWPWRKTKTSWLRYTIEHRIDHRIHTSGEKPAAGKIIAHTSDLKKLETVRKTRGLVLVALCFLGCSDATFSKIVIPRSKTPIRVYYPYFGSFSLSRPPFLTSIIRPLSTLNQNRTTTTRAETNTRNAATNDIGTASNAQSSATSSNTLNISSTQTFGAGTTISGATMGNITTTISPTIHASGPTGSTTNGASNNALSNATDSTNAS